MTQVLAVASLSARIMAEAAVREGWKVVALDLFGDADTRQASVRWVGIGDDKGERVDPQRLLRALHELASHGEAIGWIVGSGFDGQAGLLEEGAAALPLFGTAPRAMARLRDPATFFGWLASEGIAHPEVSLARPACTEGWLAKDAGACGGVHIRPARADDPDPPASRHHYWQRLALGAPMSATFLANGRDACVLGFNELLVRRVGGRPWVFHGAIGPVPLPARTAARVSSILRRVVAAFDLRGIGSLDFLLDGDDPLVLEINPRVPATLALYERQEGWRGLIGAHLQACRDGELAPRPLRVAAGTAGLEVLFAKEAFTLSAPAAARLAASRGVHDLPRAGQRFAAGDPLCSVSARGSARTQVHVRLAAAREAAWRALEMRP